MNDSIYNYYCDESCHLENDKKRYMVLGYISIPYSRIKKIKEQIKDIRKKHKNKFEIKWTYLNSWNYQFYSELIDFFFEISDIGFRAIIVDKNKYIADKCGNDYDRFYYLMYYQLIYHKLDTQYIYNIYVDIKDQLSACKINQLKDILNVKMGVIQKIQHIRSNESDLLQLCDLLIGALSYNLNNKEKMSDPKIRLIDKIMERSGYNLLSQTPKSESKFNIFKILI
ncbi:hypothetical protein EZS27_009377 [termite gut metagenome]|uniref:DUF3800 domain-containing protein n=1 Tax=termite gut metagenome TaxID=433724 RepID=A0A5J4SA40_9ZZZZ